METKERKLLILDLDETLIYGVEEALERPPDFFIGPYFIYRRPLLSEFLAYCFDAFEVAVWTTATQSYAEAILDVILDGRQQLKFLWTRERCTMVYDHIEQSHYYVKRMSKLRKRDFPVERTIVVDDSPHVWANSYGNLVRVEKFEGSETDDELQKLPLYLNKISTVENIRKIEKRNWRRQI